ncbi:LysR family transcriptional regulator [Vibrio sp. WXL103]|uniref:LysR family transcriptional regulator n=1 Tax=Vibrio sp. WXL103 TaxID=3450710 RepID=UPI003EC74177
MLTFDQLEAFVAVVKQGSFAAAARSLSKDRSTIHQLIAYLEIEWDMPLFNREGKLPILRPEAERLFLYAESMIHQRKEISHFASSVNQSSEQLEICISYDPILPKEIVSKLIAFVQDRYPSTLVHLITKNRQDSINALNKGEVDLAIHMVTGKSQPEKGLFGVTVGALRYAFYCSTLSDLQQLKPCPLEKLRAKKQLFLESFTHADMTDGTRFSAIYQSMSSVEMIAEWLKRDRESYALLPTQEVQNYSELVELDVDFLAAPAFWSWTCLCRNINAQSPLHIAIRQEVVHLFEGLLGENR